jgi:hypothetical protein
MKFGDMRQQHQRLRSAHKHRLSFSSSLSNLSFSASIGNIHVQARHSFTRPGNQDRVA